MLKRFITALNDCVWAFDLQKRAYLFLSPNISGITGYALADFYQNENLWDEITYSADRDMVKAADAEIGTAEWSGVIYRILTSEGKTRWINHKRSLFIDEANGHHILLNVVNDVSAQQQISPFLEEITWTKNNLEALINNTEDYIWSINKEGRYVYMNAGYRSRIMATRGIVAQEGDDAYQHSGSTDEVNEKWRSYYQRALLGERYVVRHESAELNSDELSYFEVSFNPIYKETHHEVVGVGCFARDITERLKIEKALIAQNEKLRSIASLSSHDLRRPVASMLGLINIIDRKNFSNPENARVIEHLLTVSQEIDDVIRLIVNKTFTDILPEDNPDQ